VPARQVETSVVLADKRWMDGRARARGVPGGGSGG